MKKTVRVRNLTLGEGIPKICVPVMGTTKEEVLAFARTAADHGPDLLEWRADYFADAAKPDAVCAVLRELRELLGERPLLFTFRTRAEGGERALPAEDYRALCAAAVRSGQIDLLDVELFLGAEPVSFLIREAHASGVAVIVSNHDFAATPPKEELIRRLQMMQDIGADIAKIAVMPKSSEDVLTLLVATEECSRTLSVPVITMSMGEKGVISRLVGEAFGSALTFGMTGRASAPGQISIEALREILQSIHAHLSGGGNDRREA